MADAAPGPDVTFMVTDRISLPFVTPVATELRHRGHTIGIITNLHGEPLPSELADLRADSTDIPMTREPHPPSDARALLRLWRHLRQSRPRVVHTSTPKAALLGTIAGRLAGVPHVQLQIRGLRSEREQGVRGVLLRFSESLPLRLAHGVTFDSHSLLDTARRMGLHVPATAQVIGQGSSIGVDCQRFHPGRTGDSRPTIGFVGRLHTDKGAGDLLPLLDELLPRHPDLRLLVLGDVDPTDPASPGIRAALEAHPSVDLRGWVADTAPTYREMDLLVFPSRREGLPNAPLEAQASGVPVVGYAATGTVDAVKNGVGGILVPVGERDRLKTAVSNLLDHDEARQKLASQGRSSVLRSFEQAQVIRAHGDHLQGLLSEPHSD